MKIEFDDDDFGGFTVTEGQLKQIPYGWEEVSSGRFEPKWPQCRYRRLTVQSIRGRVNMVPYCLLYKNPVTFDQCANCDRHKPPLEYLAMTPEIQAALESQNPEMLKQFLAETDPVFNPPKQEKKVELWLPCRHRLQVKTDCCTKQKCGEQHCPLYLKVVKRKDCKNCDFRED